MKLEGRFIEKRRGAASLIGWYRRRGREDSRENALSVTLDVFVRATSAAAEKRVAVGRSSSSPSELAV